MNLEGLARAFGAFFEALLDGLSEAVMVAFGCHGAGPRFYRCGAVQTAGQSGEVAELHPWQGRFAADESAWPGRGETLGVLGLVVFWAFIGKQGPYRDAACMRKRVSSLSYTKT
jgi:hypothetical protein